MNLEDITDDEIKFLKNIRNQNLNAAELKVLAKGLKYKNKAQVKTFNHKSGKKRKFKFALLGDTHIGNKSDDLKSLWDFYNVAYGKGIREFYHSGDMVDGLHVHRGQEYELYALGLSQQCKVVIEDYPHLKGAKTFYIKGNHDQWYDQNAGASISDKIDPARSDLICLGNDEADILVGNGTKLRLLHPGGGSSYALSYKPQKLIESIQGGNKPNIMGIGHYHKSLQMFYRNVFTFLTGTFEHQTPFMRKKNLSAHIGGWIIEGLSGSKGGINEITATFIPYMNFKGDGSK